MIATPTASMRAGAEMLLADPSRWTHARRKADGREFWIVKGRTNSYYTTPDACTCPGWQARKVCSHQVAATMREAQQAARQGQGFPCPGCRVEMVEERGSLCLGCRDKNRCLTTELFGA